MILLQAREGVEFAVDLTLLTTIDSICTLKHISYWTLDIHSKPSSRAPPGPFPPVGPSWPPHHGRPPTPLRRFTRLDSFLEEQHDQSLSWRRFKERRPRRPDRLLAFPIYNVRTWTISGSSCLQSNRQANHCPLTWKALERPFATSPWRPAHHITRGSERSMPSFPVRLQETPSPQPDIQAQTCFLNAAASTERRAADR